MPANSRFSVAVHTLAALGFLQKHGVERVSSRQIAKSVNTNPVVIRVLLRSLKEAGLVDSKEGKDGGVRLARAPSRISLQEIYEAVEVQGALGMNHKPELKACPVSCAMKRIMPSIVRDVDRAIARILKTKTLAQVIEQVSATS